MSQQYDVSVKKNCDFRLYKENYLANVGFYITGIRGVLHSLLGRVLMSFTESRLRGRQMLAQCKEAAQNHPETEWLLRRWCIPWTRECSSMDWMTTFCHGLDGKKKE